MHIFQPTHTKLSQTEVDKLLVKLNISHSQLPKIKITDSALPKDCQLSDIVKIERDDDGKKVVYYRVVSI